MKPSLFSQTVDAVVYGTGMVGLGAVGRLQAAGAAVLWLNPSADLLWEATRAGETAIHPGPEPWQAWLHEAGQGSVLDPVAAEIHLSKAWLGGALVFGAVPVSVEVEAGQLRAVAVATRGGIETLRATQWVDASEHGTLARLLGPAVARKPSTHWWSLLAQAKDPDAFLQAAGDAATATCHRQLVRLRWQGGEGWHTLAEKVRELRAALPEGWSIIPSGERAFPIYETGGGGWAGEVENVIVASPTLRGEALTTLEERFRLGWELHAAPRATVGEGCASADVVAEVAIAGAGTAGAVAAIAAARQGVRTVVLDAADAPGGIGTLGGITGYFHGAPGGLQEEIDTRAEAWGLLLTGEGPKPKRWHALARTWALYELFEAAGVCFLPGGFLYDVEMSEPGVVATAHFAGEHGTLRVSAPAWVDATGDADLCARAGAPFSHGREGDGRSLSYSQLAYTAQEGEGWRGWNFDAGWVDATDPLDLTRARLEGISQYTAFSGKPGEVVAAFAPLLGVRQSRQVVADYVVSLSDLVAGRQFADSIGQVESVADTHSVDFEFESDEAAFYFWSCRGFRNRLRAELPYRMLLPKGVRNVWVACRGAGISVDAAYGLRMQREMQRLGEAAGVAAALAVRQGGEARAIPLGALQTALRESGSLYPLEAAAPASWEELLALLDAGVPGVWLWHLYRTMVEEPGHRSSVVARLQSADAGVSFCAAAACAMAGEGAAQERLLKALATRERGPEPGERPVPGAFGQLIDIPYWLQAAILLRRVGTEAALPHLRGVLEEEVPFNVRTTVGLTLLALAARLGAHPELVAAAEFAAALPVGEADLPPSRSLWRQLAGEPEKQLANQRGPDTRQSHAWQWSLILSRLFARLHLPPPAVAAELGADVRGFVRQTACLK